MKVGEFFLELVVDASKGEVTIGNLVQMMGQLEVASVGEIAVLLKLAQTLNTITTEFLNSSLGLHDFSIHTGVSTKTLQEWQAMARHTTTNADDVATSLSGITRQMSLMKDFGQTNQPIKNLVDTLGIDLGAIPTNHPEKLLEAIASNKIFLGWNDAKRATVLAQSGLEPMIDLIEKLGIVSKFRNEAGIITNRDVHNAEKIHSIWGSLENISLKFRHAIGSSITGGILDAVENPSDMKRVSPAYQLGEAFFSIASNKKFQTSMLRDLKDFMTEYGKVGASVLSSVGTTPAIFGLAQQFDAFKNFMTGGATGTDILDSLFPGMSPVMAAAGSTVTNMPISVIVYGKPSDLKDETSARRLGNAIGEGIKEKSDSEKMKTAAQLGARTH